MQKIRETFIKSINSAQEIIILYDYLERNHFDAIEYSDLLRWAWVQSLSVLDKLVHDIVLFCVTDIFINNKPIKGKFKNFTITASQCRDLLNTSATELEIAIRNIIADKNSYETFQDPDKICEALSCIWEENKKFENISLKMGLNKDYVRIKLKNIVARRNQIAHQNDMLADNFEKELINKTETLDVIEFIKSLGLSICNCIDEFI